MVLIRDAERNSWVLYPYGVANMGVRIAGPDAEVLARHILDGPPNRLRRDPDLDATSKG